MSEATKPQQTNVASLIVNAQYIKDLSFEIPGAPRIFAELANAQTELNIQVNLASEPLQEKTYEVVLRITVEAKGAGKTAFIAELAYAGVFTVDVAPEHLEPVLLVECPRLLFPFARATLAEITREGGFPPVILQPMDFVALYQARMQQQGTAGTA